VIRNAAARESPSPNQPVCHSHSFRRQIKAFGVDLEAVGPGTRNRQTREMIAAGARRLQRAKVIVDIFSFSRYGKLISALLSENGLLLGVTDEKTAPTPAATIMITQSKT
jgi:hypothetical protein